MAAPRGTKRLIQCDRCDARALFSILRPVCWQLSLTALRHVTLLSVD